ncbi:MAG: ComEC/Rec2 family competence protein [Thermomicrobium sp.]|nr:ComEC/Rec2 family competence protein [Thermomicrobium sp.]
MSGAWLALGFLASAATSTWPVVTAVAVLASLAATTAVIGGRSFSGAQRALLLVGAGAAAGWIRFGLFPDPSALSREMSGVVQLVEDDGRLGRTVVVLRDDGALVALRTRDSLPFEPGETVVWQGDYRSGAFSVGSVRVPGTYEITAIRRATDTDATFGGVRSIVRSTVLRSVPEPSGSLALGMLTGDDRGLSAATRAVLRQAGLSHLTAVSGWNVALIAAALEGALSRVRLRRWVSWAIVGSGVWGYAVLTGLEPPVLRAATMTSLYLLARWRGWPREPLAALGWAVVALLLVRPELARSLAFQLSGIATAALCASDLWQRRDRWEAIRSPVVVQLAVTPLLLLRFGTYSLVAPIANVLVEPVVPLLMGATLAVLPGAVVPGLGAVLGFPAWLLGRWVVAVAEWSTRLPGASGLAASPPVWIVSWGYLVAGSALLAWIDRRSAAP